MGGEEEMRHGIDNALFQPWKIDETDGVNGVRGSVELDLVITLTLSILGRFIPYIYLPWLVIYCIGSRSDLRQPKHWCSIYTSRPLFTLKQIESCSCAHHDGMVFCQPRTRIALALIKFSVGVWNHQPSQTRSVEIQTLDC
jgi:hypothetical protein